ncbi:unnamed protein product [Mycena citricolor]|uniref:Sec24-like protein n=1 Tax=Mycena citricolor TaxID=2018698 RepID=A0AAD2HH26_9AGAR|nr:unnamed protein product [Mycena citricolor]
MYTHASHIPQPPHSAGARPQGFRTKINPAQIPSATEAIEFDRHQWEDSTYSGIPGEHVPLSTSDHSSIDQGNSTPKFIRMTTWNVPYTSKLAADCALPIVAAIQPFADQDPRDEPIPVVDFGEHGPPRCAGCRAYINPWCTWTRGGSTWSCNLCSAETEVSSEYFCNLDAHNMRRMDHDQRMELNRGTVDFIVSEEYWATNPPERLSMPYFSVERPQAGPRCPGPMKFLFAFDVSGEALHSGILHTACAVLRDLLFGPNACFPSSSELAILTFDTSLHFYDLSSDAVSMLVVSDIDEVFVPLRTGLFVKPADHQSAIENLLTSLPDRFVQMPFADAALGSLLRASVAALSGHGGQVVVFQSTMPRLGPGALLEEPREAELYDTPKETTLYVPRDNTWREIGSECVEEGIGVSMFLTMSKYIDVGSIGEVASITGGELFFHPRFTPARDGPVLAAQLDRLIRRTTAYNCMMRIRVSNGLRISGYSGNFNRRGGTDLEFGVMDADKAISVTIKHTGSLDVRAYAYLQSAVLYTTVDGQRRVRTCNLALPVVELAWNVFQFADMDTTVYHLAREAVAQTGSERLSNIRDDLTESCSAVLLAYRKKCSNTSSIDQVPLILPEAYKALPMFSLAIQKSKPLRAARNVSSDVRNYHRHRMLSIGVRQMIHLLYPPLLALHDLSDSAGFADPSTGRLEMPDIMRDSHLYMEGHGVYLIDNGEMMVLWIGGSVSPQLLLDMFGVDDLMLLDSQMTSLPRLDTRLSMQVNNIIDHRRHQRGGRLPKFSIARQNLDAAEIEFSDMLVEDQNTGAMAYSDYLSVVHNQIKQVLRDGGSLGGGVAFRSSIW